MRLYSKDSASRLDIVLFHVTEITGKVLLDRNTMYSLIVHRIHGYGYYSLFWLLFTMYTITVDCYTILLLSLYRPSILSNMILIVLIELNNNVKRPLALRLVRLMEETASVFWVDLGYRLRSWHMVPLQSSERWLTSHLFIVPQCYCEYCSTVILWVLLLLLTTWR